MAIKNLIISPISALTGSIALSVIANAAVACNPTSVLVGSLAMTVVSSRPLAFSPSSEVRGSLALGLVTGQPLAFSPGSMLGGSIGMIIGQSRAISCNPISQLSGSISLSGVGDGTTLADVVDVILGTWGIFSRCSAPAFVIEEAINIVNASLQMVWNNAAEKSYWSRRELSLTYAVGSAVAPCPDNVQNVIGPVWINQADKQPLVPVGTRPEIDNFASIYLEGEAFTEPLAYYVDRTNQSGNEPAKVQIRISPTPTVSVEVILTAIVEPTRYTVSAIGDLPVIPIPHQYCESLLLPICRYNASTFSLFWAKDQREAINAGYRQAMLSLGLADPLPGKSGDNLSKRREAQPA